MYPGCPLTATVRTGIVRTVAVPIRLCTAESFLKLRRRLDVRARPDLLTRDGTVDRSNSAHAPMSELALLCAARIQRQVRTA